MPESPYYKGITNFKDILQTKYDKPFESISDSDIRKDMISQGYSKKDVKDVVQGFRKFKKKDADFTFENGGFRINTRAGALRGSGRKKGRSVDESGLAKLLNLGQDVSKFAEFADVAARKVNTPDVITPTEDTGDVDVDFTDEEIFGGIDPFASGPVKGGSKGSTGGGKGNGKTPINKEDIPIETPDFGISDALDLNLPLMEDEGSKLSAGDNPAFKSIAKPIYNAFYRQTGVSYDAFREKAKKEQAEADKVGFSRLKGGTPNLDIARAIDDLAGTNIKDIPILGNILSNVGPGGIKGGTGLTPKNIGEALSKRGKLFKGVGNVSKYVKDKVKSFLPKSAAVQRQAQRQALNAEKTAAGAKATRQATTAAKVKPSVKDFGSSQFTKKGTTFKDVLQESIDAKSNIKNVNVNLQKNLAPVVKKLSGQPIGKINPVSQFADQLRAAGKTVGVMKDGTRVRVGAGGAFQVFAKGGKISNGRSDLTSRYGKYENLTASIDPNLGKQIWQDQKDDSPLMFSREYYNGLEGDGYPVESPRTSDDTSLLSYMKMGGKLPMAANGRKLVGGVYTEAGLYDKFNPFKSRGSSGPDVQRLDLNSNIQTPNFNIDPQAVEIPELTDPINKKTADFKKQQLEDTKKGTHQADGLGEDYYGGFNLNDLLYYGSTLGLPAGAALTSHLKTKELEDKLVPNFQAPELNVGTVRDIRRPDFSTPYNPTTADTGVENANRQFQLAQNEQGERAFEAAQDESKIRQEEAIRENQNRQQIINAETRNKEEQVRSGIAANRYFGALNRRDQALIGGADTLATTAVQRQYISSKDRTERAKELIRRGKVEEGMALLQGKRKFGGKLSKFSNGR